MRGKEPRFRVCHGYTVTVALVSRADASEELRNFARIIFLVDHNRFPASKVTYDTTEDCGFPKGRHCNDHIELDSILSFPNQVTPDSLNQRRSVFGRGGRRFAVKVYESKVLILAR